MADTDTLRSEAHRARAARERTGKIGAALCQVGIVLAGLGIGLLGHAHELAEDQAEKNDRDARELAEELALSVKREYEAREAPRE